MIEHGESENNRAYRRLKEMIDQSYPKGWFVGIADERVVGAAETFRELENSLRAQGKDPRTVLVVQAGISPPNYVTIFA
ncbi:MAG: hypothetical protein L0Y71_20700 [Gemmataceae bacterium]|nr:hypothetical protein [Gemmataceae bacterium]